MKRTITIALLFATLVVSPLAADDQYVVTFRPEAAIEQLAAVAEQFAAAHGGTVIDVDGIRGTLLVHLPESRVTTARRDPRVQSIRPATDAAEAVPWSTGVSYSYDGAGNVTKIGTNDEFVYDVASRLVQAKINGQTRNYEYDAYGNRTKCLQGITDCQGHAIDPSTNRLSGASHDAAGNVTSLDGHQYSYDALNMQIRDVDTASGVVREYVYTADDERIAVYTEGQWWRWTIRDTSGKVLREYMSEGAAGTSNWKWVKDYVWRDGILLAMRHVPPGGSTAVTYHYHVDHLGTPRRITDDSDRIVGFHDYFAFGPETTTGKTEPSLTLFKYTGHERDMVDTTTSAPLDYMHARYYSNSVGRFLSLDRAPGSPASPQSWNRYSYANNSPLRMFDPDGLAGRDILVVPVTIVTATRDKELQHRVQRSVARAQSFFAQADVHLDVKRVSGSITYEQLSVMGPSRVSGTVNGPNGPQGIFDFVKNTRGIVVIVGDSGKFKTFSGETAGVGGPTLLGTKTGAATVSDELAHALGNVPPFANAVGDLDPALGEIYRFVGNGVADVLTDVQEGRTVLGLGLQSAYSDMLRAAAAKIINCPQGTIPGTSGPCD